jgi:hypothetical protein
MNHPRGRRKARVFSGDSGAGATGYRFTADFQLNRGNRRAGVGSAWIILRDETAPEADELFCTIGIEVRDARTRTTLGGGFAGRQQGP